MDFRSKKRRDLLALLLSISATTCSAPQDDRPDFTLDPPNVEMASQPSSSPFPYRASAEADLTGDGLPETLRLVAAGQGPL